MERALALDAWGRPLRLTRRWWFWNLLGEQAVFLPLALGLGLLGLGAFLWSLKTGQYDDLEGAAWRAVMDDDAPGEGWAKEV